MQIVTSRTPTYLPFSTMSRYPALHSSQNTKYLHFPIGIGIGIGSTPSCAQPVRPPASIVCVHLRDRHFPSHFIPSTPAPTLPQDPDVSHCGSHHTPSSIYARPSEVPNQPTHERATNASQFLRGGFIFGPTKHVQGKLPKPVAWAGEASSVENGTLLGLCRVS